MAPTATKETAMLNHAPDVLRIVLSSLWIVTLIAISLVSYGYTKGQSEHPVIEYGPTNQDRQARQDTRRRPALVRSAYHKRIGSGKGTQFVECTPAVGPIALASTPVLDLQGRQKPKVGFHRLECPRIR